MKMTKEEFEEIAEEALNRLPEYFLSRLENVHIVIEDYPSEYVLQSRNENKHSLLGLYEGVPLLHRGQWYGMYPVTPDKITLYRKNIEAVCKNTQEIELRIYEVMFHEIGHHFGMNEEEVREALRNYD